MSLFFAWKGGSTRHAANAPALSLRDRRPATATFLAATSCCSCASETSSRSAILSCKIIEIYVCVSENQLLRYVASRAQQHLSLCGVVCSLCEAEKGSLSLSIPVYSNLRNGGSRFCTEIRCLFLTIKISWELCGDGATCTCCNISSKESSRIGGIQSRTWLWWACGFCVVTSHVTPRTAEWSITY